ncbi:MAG: PAS domain S-box protein, partial [Dehalococcoidia bacterium]
MQFLPKRLGPKLNLSLLVFFLLLGGATSALVFFGFQRTQDDATDLSRQALEVQGSETLERLADQTSFSGQLIVQQATTDASAAASYLANAHQLGATVPWDPARLTPAPNGALIDPSTTRTTDVWVPASLEMNERLRDDLSGSATLDALFPTLERGNPDAVAIYYVTPSGAVRQYPPYGRNDSLPADFDFFSQPGFEDFRSGATAPTVARWTAPYESPAVLGLTITALAPVFQDGVYRGVIGVDVAVPRLIARVDAVRYTPGGYAFVIDRNGGLVPSRFSDDVQRLIDDPDKTQFASTVQAMRAGRSGFGRVDIGDEDVIVAYAPLGDLGGSLALVSPVDELTAQAAAVTSSIEEQGDQTLAFILATMLGFFIAGLLAAAWFNRRMLTSPVESLVRGTRAVAAGNYSVRMPIESTDELGMLADSFNIMIEQIDLGQQRLEQRNRELHGEIAERTRVEEELRRSEDLYRTLAHNFPNGTVVLYDRDLRFQIVDGQGIRSLGLAKEDVEGKLLDDLFTPRVRETLGSHMRVVFDGESSVFEIEAQDRVFVAYTLPLYDERSEIFAGMAMTQDITERKQAEAELAEREAQYRSIFASVSDGLIITGPDGAIVEVNPAFADMHGYSHDEMLAVHPMTFIDPESHHLFAEYSETVAAGGVYRCRATDVRKDGSTFPVEVMGRPVLYSGSPHVLGVVRDITEQVETERLLEQRVSERTREIAALLDISHAVTATLELKTLVAVILQQLGQVVENNAASVLLREGDELAIMEFDESVMGRPSTGGGLRFTLEAADAIWRQALQRQPAIIHDIYDDSELAASFREAVGGHLAGTFSHVRAALFVPLALQDEVIGVVAISHGTPGYFTEHNAALVMAIANHAAIAIENARLFARVEQRTRELSTLLELSHSVASTLSLNQLVPVILESLQAVIAYMGASILLRDGDELAIVTYDPSIDTSAPRQSPLRFALDESLPLWQNMLRHEPALITDVRDDSPLARSFRQTVGQNIIDSTFDLVNAVLVVPLASQGVVIGVVALSGKAGKTYYRT